MMHPLFRSILQAHGAPAVDPRDLDPSRPDIFATHNCWKCQDSMKPCAHGNPSGCEYLHARND
jgi:hypothetical protein